MADHGEERRGEPSAGSAATGPRPSSTAGAIESSSEASKAEFAERAAALEAIMDAMPDGLVVFDAAGVIVRMNAVAASTWGGSGIDLYEPGEPPSTLELRGENGGPFAPRDWPVRRALAGERVKGVHVRLATGRSRPIWVLASAAPVLDGAGKVTGAVLLLSDETAVRDLAEARDDLVRMVTHDLRTPLTAIMAQAHLIRRGDPSAAIVERVAAIERSCDRMNGMIRDLVDVTLLESGQFPMALSRVDVAAILPDILHGARGGLAVDRVRLRSGGGCYANLDPERLERIVVNLVSNALKYSSGEVRVEVERAAGEVSITVADAGVGISPEDQARIFDRYYRARGDRRPEGLGLGLYITRLLVEGQGGRIGVESQLGKGSTFRVRFLAA